MKSWIHVDDHNHGVTAILEKGVPGETYCLGGDAEMANLNIAKLVLKELGKSEDLLTFVQDRPGHDRRYAMDTTRAKRELGWDQQYSFEEGLRQTIAWYVERANELSVDEQGVHTK
jgi:dTDP-glucose 4,6-dehydratase